MNVRAPLVSALALAAMGVAACSTPPRPASVPTSIPNGAPSRAVSSGTPLERFLPLVGGHLYQYEFENDAARGMLAVRIQRQDERHGAWVLPQGGHAFEYRTDGVLSENEQGASYLLQSPLAVGARWRGGNQSWIEVSRTGATVEVPAGTFRDCVETKETRGGDAPLLVVATFCPEVGMVQRIVQSGSKRERLVLKSFGPPVDLGPDGLKVTRDE